jgi:hypothetical protein
LTYAQFIPFQSVQYVHVTRIRKEHHTFTIDGIASIPMHPIEEKSSTCQTDRQGKGGSNTDLLLTKTGVEASCNPIESVKDDIGGRPTHLQARGVVSSKG